jgi:hypothetical protein
MTKIRTPYTPEYTLSRVIETAGISMGEISEAVGKSTDLIYKWSNPDKEVRIPCSAGLAIDQLCMKKNQSAPFADLYHRAAHLFGYRTRSIFGVKDAVLHVQAALGHLAGEAASALMLDGDDRKISVNLRHQLMMDIEDMRGKLDELERAVIEASKEEARK